MAEKVLMLALSPTMESGTIVSWHKREGEVVAQGDLLCEVETDKAVMEYESTYEGTLLKILISEGSEAAVGETIAVVGKAGEDIAALLSELEAAAASAAAAPAAAPAPAPKASPAPAPSPAAAPAPAPPAGQRIKSSPLARKLAGRLSVDLAALTGSGPAGRVIKRDVEQAAARPPAAGKVAAGRIAEPVGDIRLPLSGKRRLIAQRMAESKFSAPHYYLKIDVAVDSLMAARAALNRGRQEKVSLNAFLIKFAAEALKRHPKINAGWEEDAIVQRGRIDIGLAVAQDDGLITPVVRDCGAKGIIAIDGELQELVARAREGRLQMEEYSGAGFTISNLGSTGILEFTAIINPPGSAILAVGRIDGKAVEDPEERSRIKMVPTMILTLSCDHRVIDGKVGAAFLATLKRLIEDPVQALY
jgi:pyruvate dehydrogenase E2 component (dihydrolipoamide acetyltransferase)